MILVGGGAKFPRILQGVRLEVKPIVSRADGSHCRGVIWRGGWGFIQVTQTFRGLSALHHRQGKVEYMGIFAIVKGIAGVGLTCFKTSVLASEENNFA